MRNEGILRNEGINAINRLEGFKPCPLPTNRKHPVDTHGRAYRFRYDFVAHSNGYARPCVSTMNPTVS
jgi:hypothetical protein